MAKKYTEEVVRKIVEEDTNQEYTLLEIESIGKICPKTGKRKKREMTISHNCGHEYTLDIYEFIKGKRRCGKCKGQVLKEHFLKPIESIKQQTHDMTNGEYEFVDNHYNGYKHIHTFYHKLCNKKFHKSWDKFKNSGQRCTHCQKKGKESRASIYVRDILDYFDVTYINEKRFKDCINPDTGKILPFDYYLPDINVIIEVDGEQHERGTFTNWDTSGVMQRDKIKNKYAKQKNIELFRIPTKKQKHIPKILHSILSKELLRSLTVEEIEAIPQSTPPERITADLKKVHNKEYELHDKFFHGVDTQHKFIHLTCGTIFTKTLQSLRTEKYPCPNCREIKLKLDNHEKYNRLLIKKSKGRYCLDKSNIGIDEKKRRLIRCNTCKKSWYSIVANIMKDRGGCPNCKHIKGIRRWMEMYYLIIAAFNSKKSLDKKQMQWIYWNKRKYAEGKLQKYRIRLLKRANLNLI